MNKSVYKYSIEVTDYQSVKMPRDAKILYVQLQYNSPHLWALVDKDAPIVNRHIRIIGTGHLADDVSEVNYIGSFQMNINSIPLVFHVFDGGEK